MVMMLPNMSGGVSNNCAGSFVESSIAANKCAGSADESIVAMDAVMAMFPVAFLPRPALPDAREDATTARPTCPLRQRPGLNQRLPDAERAYMPV
jgi:hypothetical protein